MNNDTIIINDTEYFYIPKPELDGEGFLYVEDKSDKPNTFMGFSAKAVTYLQDTTKQEFIHNAQEWENSK